VRIRFIEDRTAPKQRLGAFRKIAGTASVRNGLADSITIRLKLHGSREEVAAIPCAKSMAWRLKTNRNSGRFVRLFRSAEEQRTRLEARPANREAWGTLEGE
jgi:hypothetical protein